ncbi:FlgO family outer membrane protein [Glaciecola sp. 1036]|uniref:FlgO family outer membrane protein n=1 Tax=Alteromonadaceae TaxID=72275 RepID=UPI003CFBE80A
MKFVFITGLIFVLSGCSSMSMPEFDILSMYQNDEPEQEAAPEIVDVVAADNQNYTVAQDDRRVDAFGAMLKPNVISQTPGAYKSTPYVNHVGDYVRDMAQDLVSTMEYVTERTPVAVTNFVLIDSDLRETNLLGQQMAESFVHEFHKFRMPVVEYKATQFIRITETGDYILSRDYLELNNSTPIRYVLTGTMTKHQGGYIINAKMLGMESKVVVASAQTFIPFYVVDALLPSSSSRQNDVVDGVRIIRGE